MTATTLPATTTNPSRTLATATKPLIATDEGRPVRSRQDDIRALPTVLRSEWIKLRSLRANKAIFALTVGINAFVAWAVAGSKAGKIMTASQVFVFPALLTAVLAAVTGILIFTTEAQHGTLATSLTAQPSRWLIAVSKMITMTAVGVVLASAGMVAAFAGATGRGLPVGDTSGMAATTGYAVVFTVLAALIGLGIGMVARHSAAAVSGLLVWWFVGENLLRAFLSANVSRFMPFDAGYRMLGVASDMDTPEILAAQLTRPQLAMVFATYAVVAVTLGTVLLYRRDTN